MPIGCTARSTEAATGEAADFASADLQWDAEQGGLT